MQHFRATTDGKKIWVEINGAAYESMEDGTLECIGDNITGIPIDAPPIVSEWVTEGWEAWASAVEKKQRAKMELMEKLSVDEKKLLGLPTSYDETAAFCRRL